mgnify:CR=1 FL=1
MKIKILTIDGLDLYDEKIKQYVQTNVYDDLNDRLSVLEKFINSINQDGYELMLVKKGSDDTATE